MIPPTPDREVRRLAMVLRIVVEQRDKLRAELDRTKKMLTEVTEERDDLELTMDRIQSSIEWERRIP